MAGAGCLAASSSPGGGRGRSPSAHLAPFTCTRISGSHRASEVALCFLYSRMTGLTLRDAATYPRRRATGGSPGSSPAPHEGPASRQSELCPWRWTDHPPADCGPSLPGGHRSPGVQRAVLRRELCVPRLAGCCPLPGAGTQSSSCLCAYFLGSRGRGPRGWVRRVRPGVPGCLGCTWDCPPEPLEEPPSPLFPQARPPSSRPLGSSLVPARAP